MQLLKDENPADNPLVQKFLKDVLLKEEEAFNRIFTRFCLLNGVRFDLAKINTVTRGPVAPNLVEYYYIGKIPKGTGEIHFLMSRNLAMVPGEDLPVLNITFNADLLDETKEK